MSLQKAQQAGNHPSPLAEAMPVYKPGRCKADPGLRCERSDLGLAYRGSPQFNPLPHTCQSLPPSCKQGVSQRAQGAGQAAMRKGLGRGAFICGVRRSLDSSTSVEGLLVAGLPPCVPVWGLQLGWRGWGGGDLQPTWQAHRAALSVGGVMLRLDGARPWTGCRVLQLPPVLCWPNCKMFMKSCSAVHGVSSPDPHITRCAVIAACVVHGS